MIKPLLKPKTRKRSTRPGRLKGKALEELRRNCFERDGYRCQHEIRPVMYVLGWPNHFRCLKQVTWESGHMAHIRARSLGGKDELSNVVCKCADCHIRREHTLGEKSRDYD